MTPRHDTAPQELTDRDFPSAVLLREEPVVVEFHFAGWERPWRGLTAEAWTEIGREFGERLCRATLETGANRAMATRYGAESIPQVLVFLGGEVVARFQGRTEPGDVCAAVREALRQARSCEEAREELEALSGSRGSLLRSVLRRRTSDVRRTRVPARERELASAG